MENTELKGAAISEQVKVSEFISAFMHKSHESDITGSTCTQLHLYCSSTESAVDVAGSISSSWLSDALNTIVLPKFAVLVAPPDIEATNAPGLTMTTKFVELAS